MRFRFYEYSRVVTYNYYGLISPIPGGNFYDYTMFGVPVRIYRQNPNTAQPVGSLSLSDTWWVDYEYKLGPSGNMEWFGHAYKRLEYNGTIFEGTTSDHRFLTMGGSPEYGRSVFVWGGGSAAGGIGGGASMVTSMVEDLSEKSFGLPLPAPTINIDESFDGGRGVLNVSPGHVHSEAYIPTGNLVVSVGATASDIRSTLGWQALLQARGVTPLGEPSETTGLFRAGSKYDIKPSNTPIDDEVDESLNEDDLAFLGPLWGDTLLSQPAKAISWHAQVGFGNLASVIEPIFLNRHWGVYTRLDKLDAWIPTKSWQLRSDFDDAPEELENDLTKLPMAIAFGSAVKDVPFLKLKLPKTKVFTLGAWAKYSGSGSVSSSTLTSTGSGTVFSSTATYTNFYPYRWLRLQLSSDVETNLTVRIVQRKVTGEDPLSGGIDTEFVKTYSITVNTDDTEYWIDTLNPEDEAFADVERDDLNAAVYAHKQWVLATRFTGISFLHRLELEFSNAVIEIQEARAECRFRANIRCGGTSRHISVLPASGDSQTQPYNMWIGEVDGRDAFRLGPPSVNELLLKDTNASYGWLDIDYWNQTANAWSSTQIGTPYTQYNWVNEAGNAFLDLNLLEGGVIYKRGGDVLMGHVEAAPGNVLIQFNNHLMGWYYGSPQRVQCEQVFGHAVGATVVPMAINRMVAATVDNENRFPFATDGLGYGRRSVHWYPDDVAPFNWTGQAPVESGNHFVITGASENFPAIPERADLYHGGHNWGAFEFAAFPSVVEDEPKGGLHSTFDPWRGVRLTVQFGDRGLLLRKWSEIRPRQEFVIRTDPTLSAQVAWHPWGQIDIVYCDEGGTAFLINTYGNENDWSDPVEIAPGTESAIATHPQRPSITVIALFDAGIWTAYRRSVPGGAFEDLGTIVEDALEASAGLAFHTKPTEKLFFEYIDGDGNDQLLESIDVGTTWEAAG